MDALQHVRELPDDLLKDIGQLIVNRRGRGPRSHMYTENIIGHVAPRTAYLLAQDRLVRAGNAGGRPEVEPVTDPPAHIRITGRWNTTEHVESEKANILGGLGTLSLAEPLLEIPEAPSTDEALAFYNARLLRVGDYVEFETKRNLPVTIMNIGENYVEEYLKVEHKGGGAFIEFHDRPHLHMPIDQDAAGYMLLGRSDGETYYLSAFRIPFGSALYTAPYALHADPYLVGRYLVVYSVTEQYSTVVFRSDDEALVDVRVKRA